MPYQDIKWFLKGVMDGSNACILCIICLTPFEPLTEVRQGNYIFGGRKSAQTMISVKAYTYVGVAHVNNI